MVVSTEKSRAKRTPTGTGKARKPVKLPFRNAALKRSFGEFCQLLQHEPVMRGLEDRWRELQSAEIEYISNEGFNANGAEASILGGCLLGSAEFDASHVRSARIAELPAYLARLCETRLMGSDEEAMMFRRMNFLLHLAEERRKEMLDSKPCELEMIYIRGLVQAAHWHRDYIVKANMRLVISIVKKFVNVNNLFDDLLSDGIMALIRAVEKFDYDRGFRFSTYATQVVRRNAYRNVMAKQKERIKMGTSIDDANVDIDDRQSASGMSPDRWNLLRSKLGHLLDKLDRREKLIVRARFSLGGHRRVQTLQRIADSLGVSKERIRQLEKRALDKLRDLASTEELPEFVPE